VLLGLAVVLAVAPVALTLLASLGIAPNLTTAIQPSSAAYTGEIAAADPRLIGDFVTGTALSVFTTLLTIAVAFPAAHALARSRRGRLALPAMLVLGSLPAIAYLIPLADTIRRVGLHDTLAGVVLSESAALAPLAVYVLHGYVAGVPADLEDAARLDGAGLARTLARVTLPAIAPGMAATAIVIFALSWNMLLQPLVLGSENVRTIPVALTDLLEFERDIEWPTAAAAIVVTLAPLALLVLAADRWLERFRLDGVA
jgi:ABC-type glycerol-3-phosphate transport system permease component